MLEAALAITPFAFAFLVIYGGLSDLSRFRIPNWVSYGLIMLFAAHELLRWLGTPYLPSLGFALPAYVYKIAIALVVFLVSTIFWKLRYIGGGDVKYLTATSLWMGPGVALPFIVLLTALAVGFALTLKLMDRWSFLVHWARLPAFAKRLFDRVRVNELPYGFPICIAALMMIPQIFRQG